MELDFKLYQIESQKALQGLEQFRTDDKSQLLMRAATGLVTETGEVVDTIKDYVFYSTELDKANLKEELGDLLWYIGYVMSLTDISFDSVLEKNIEKLSVRYNGEDNHGKFFRNGRDKEAEREIFKEP